MEAINDEKYKEALKIIFNKEVSMLDLLYCFENNKTVAFYNYFQKKRLSDEEYKLLREVRNEL